MFGVSCPEPDEQTTTIAGVLGIDLGGTEYPSAVLGDLDNVGQADLTDAILGLQVITGMRPLGLREDLAASGVDVNGYGKSGAAEVIYILQKVAGLR